MPIPPVLAPPRQSPVYEAKAAYSSNAGVPALSAVQNNVVNAPVRRSSNASALSSSSSATTAILASFRHGGAALQLGQGTDTDQRQLSEQGLRATATSRR